MSWIRIDDHTYDHPKHLRAGPEASWLWVVGLCYCSRYLTDGFLDDTVVSRLAAGPGGRAQRLVDAGLWDRVEGGYQVHDYHDYQPSSDQVKRRRHNATERVKRWRYDRNNAHGDADVMRATYTAPDPDPDPDPDPKKNVPPVVPQRGTALMKVLDDGFDRFWSVYPEKKAKAVAKRSWMKLAPDASLVDTIVAAVETQKTWRKFREGFVPLPATWLNQERWNDEPDPVRENPKSRTAGNVDALRTVLDRRRAT